MSTTTLAMIKQDLTGGEDMAGAFDYLEERAGLRGWAVDLATAGRPVLLGVRCGDAVLATAYAMRDRPDIDAALGRLSQSGFLLGWSRFDADLLSQIAAETPDALIEVFAVRTGQPLIATFGFLSASHVHKLRKASPKGDLTPGYQDVTDFHQVMDAGLFDEDWYLGRYGSQIATGLPALLDYLRVGEAAGRQPSYYFDPVHYAREAELPSPAGALLHYIAQGAAAGLSPSRHFDQSWYSSDAPPSDQTPPPTEDAETILPLMDDTDTVPGVAEDPERLPEMAAPFIDPQQSLPELQAIEPPAAEPLVPHYTIPPAASHGYAATEAWLANAVPEELAACTAEAEAMLAAGDAGRLDAAVFLAVARGRAGDLIGSANAAIVFLSEPAKGLPEVTEEIEHRLLIANHALYDKSRADEAKQVYRLFHQRGRRDYMGLVRLIELAVDKRDPVSAAPVVDTFLEAFPHDQNPWGKIAIARFYILRNDRLRAVAKLAEIPPYPDSPLAAEAVVLNCLIEAGALDEAATRLEFSSEEDPVELFSVRVRLAVRRHQSAKVAALLDDPRVQHIANWQLAEAMFLLSADGKLTLFEQQQVLPRLLEVIESRGLNDLNLLQARMHFLLQRKRLDELGLLFEATDGTPFANHRETLLRRLDYYCMTGQSDNAEQLYQQHFTNTILGKWESITVLRLLSELKQWEEAGRVLLDHVAGGHDFGAGGHMAMRVVRKSQIHQTLLDRTTQREALLPKPLQDFIALVAEDLTIIRSASVFAESRPSRFRSNWVLPDLTTGAAQGENCLFLCTNQRYFLSLLTFLCSFLGQAPQVRSRIFVFLDNDVPIQWHSMVAMVGARFHTSIELVTEAGFVPQDVDLRTEYGFFAGGNALARSAYFRLYAAQYLLDRFSFGRALYVDTDIICRADLSDLFTLDLGEGLIAAATEDYTMEVINASARNGLDPTTYFNSGVLLLGMNNPELRVTLTEAIRLVEQESERLVFHDQCALNIAFRGQVAPLPSRYNFYLRPHRERNGYIEDGALLHFVDKPKPWDIMFSRQYREEWRVWALLLGSILPQSTYIDIFASANRD